MTTDTLQQIEAQGTELVTQADVFQIQTTEQYAHAGVLIRSLTAFIRQADAFMSPIITAADAAVKTAREQREKLRGGAVRVKAALGSRMEVWDRQERDRQRQEQERLAAEAQEEAKLGAMVSAEARGDEAAVAAIAAGQSQPMAAFTPPAPPAPKAEGVSYRTDWKAEVVDLLMLIQAVARGEAPRDTLLPNLPVLNALARAHRDALSIPGVRAVSQRSTAVRA